MAKTLMEILCIAFPLSFYSTLISASPSPPCFIVDYISLVLLDSTDKTNAP